MSNIKKVLICGLGAIGSIYAVKIKEAFEKFCKFDNSFQIKVLVDQKRLNRYKETPLIFNHSVYNFDYIISDNLTNFKADLIIIAVKNPSIVEIVNSIEKFIKEDTIILSLLNGIKSEEILIEKYSEKHILYSYFIGHTSTRKNREVLFDGIGKIVFGSNDNNKNDSRVISVKNFFDKLNIDYEIPEDIHYSRWKKFMINIAFNQVSAVLNTPFFILQKSTLAKELLINLMEEVKSLAIVNGIKNTNNLIPEALKTLDEMLPSAKTSMLQDVIMKQKTEVDIFAKHIVDLGKKFNINTPYNKMFLDLINIIEEKNQLELQYNTTKNKEFNS